MYFWGRVNESSESGDEGVNTNISLLLGMQRDEETTSG